MSVPFELDQLVVFTWPETPEAQELEALGLKGFGGITRHGNLGDPPNVTTLFDNLKELFG